MRRRGGDAPASARRRDPRQGASRPNRKCAWCPSAVPRTPSAGTVPEPLGDRIAEFGTLDRHDAAELSTYGIVCWDALCLTDAQCRAPIQWVRSRTRRGSWRGCTERPCKGILPRRHSTAGGAAFENTVVRQANRSGRPVYPPSRSGPTTRSVAPNHGWPESLKLPHRAWCRTVVIVGYRARLSRWL